MMSCLDTSKDNEIRIYYQKDILTETCCFYEKLFKAVDLTDTSSTDRELSDCDVTQLSYDEAINVEGVLTYDKISFTLKKLSVPVSSKNFSALVTYAL